MRDDGNPAEMFRVRGTEANWFVEQNGTTGMSYASKEAAFEAAVGAASNAVREGRHVVIDVPAPKVTESTLGVEGANGRSSSS
ncbi:hypothetical protein [Ancylobacter sp. SL191]|uniref:hypothetical protein n=1 Tax=Ancylobacter sp. SL191 TaxID=2995166 RepID=UPI002271B963|nr:hypothetical protein [Ancylobacter sp. SL191]WAC27177.1 hypothetical protein OU996_19615 [Ancylobacter sp. SL191]